MNLKEILKILRANGFISIRQTGSHMRLKKDNKLATLALHGKKDVAIGMIRAIEKQTGVKLL